MKLWKRNSIIAAIVLFVCAAVYLNWSYSQDTQAGKTLGEAALVGAESSSSQAKTDQSGTADNKTGDAAATSQNNYFSTARLNRQQARDSALALLQQAAEDQKATAKTVEQANKAIQTMADNTMEEAQIENLVTAKGYADCVAFLSDNSISVVVPAKTDGLTSSDTAKIGEIVMEQTGLKADQIKIIEAK